jgi:hypothetical protein
MPIWTMSRRSIFLVFKCNLSLECVPLTLLFARALFHFNHCASSIARKVFTRSTHRRTSRINVCPIKILLLRSRSMRSTTRVGIRHHSLSDASSASCDIVKSLRTPHRHEKWMLTCKGESRSPLWTEEEVPSTMGRHLFYCVLNLALPLTNENCGIWSSAASFVGRLISLSSEDLHQNGALNLTIKIIYHHLICVGFLPLTWSSFIAVSFVLVSRCLHHWMRILIVFASFLVRRTTTTTTSDEQFYS